MPTYPGRTGGCAQTPGGSLCLPFSRLAPSVSCSLLHSWAPY
ncbi:hypothetical protein EI555_008102 [Monodon monoceros]|uniref:Uncharacterized protein n=1 Tax=Monodon monoceros TaxID=40151 RepID=A0A4U1EWZ2_MONMO|nr:hypothetical protein EI555_008102 [Monodon monoceros]